MKHFKPYTIVHLPITQCAQFSPPEGNVYLVLWHNKVPLGHVWYTPQAGPFSTEQWKTAILAAVEPALQYYTGGNGQWKTYLWEDRCEALGSLLDAVFSDWFSKNLSEEPESISVVICTRNRPEALATCLQALLQNTDQDREIIVVDNASDTDATQKVVAGFAGVRYIREDRKGLDIARNTGARHASNNIIAYTDDDVLVDSGWIAALKTAFRNKTTLAVTGLVIPAALQTPAQYIFEKYWGFNKGYTPTCFDHRYFLTHLEHGVPVWDIGAGANMAFRREAFELLGWFDERLDVGASGCSGDSEFWYRVLAEGWNCVYLPHIHVFHQHRSERKSLYKQLFSYMRGQVSSLLVQYERYGHKGNLHRIKRGLFNYYKHRIKNRLLKGRTPDSATLFVEIKGCFSGWKFYRAHRQYQEPAYSFANALAGRFVPAEINKDTLVSVVITCYNHAHYLAKAIQSVLDQTWAATEIVVVDDGSTDHTPGVCDYFKQVNYVRVERVGLSAARNIGVAHSKGRFLVFLDADDFLYPNAIELNLNYFMLYENVAFVSGGHDRVDAAENRLPLPAAAQNGGNGYVSLLQGNYIGMEATVMYRRSLFFKYHFNPGLSACEDYDINLRIARDFPVFSHTNKVAAYRIHDHNQSRDTKRMLHSAITVLQQQYPFLMNQAERDAYEKGMLNWNNYYMNSTAEHHQPVD